MPTDSALLEQEVRKVFAQADVEGKGVMPRATLEQLFRKLGLNDDMIISRSLDVAADSTGMVNFHRFLDWTFAQDAEACARGAVARPAAAVPPCPGDGQPAAGGPASAAWREALAAEFGSRATAIPDTAQRGITPRQLRRVLAFCERCCGGWHGAEPPGLSGTPGQRLDVGLLNLYHVNEWVVKPSTCGRPCGDSDSCAFVELLADGPQPPLWYVSHWWGEPVSQFLLCLELHCTQRALGDDAPYWVCAYANRQHDLGRELSSDPAASSFYRAMQLSRGVLLVVDHPADEKQQPTVFRRIWVQFEEAMTFRLADDRDFLLDVATARGGCAQLLADGATEIDASRKVLSTSRKTLREKAFPIEIMGAALRVTIREAQATNEEDRRRILNRIAGLPLDGPAPAKHEALECTDRRLHSIFALAAWPQAAAKGLVTEMGLPEALAADVDRKRLVLDLGRCEALAGTAEVARGLAGLRSLTALSLYLGSTRRLASIHDLSLALAKLHSLETLDLHLGCCSQLRSVDQLGKSLGSLASLKDVHLHLEGCSGILDFSEVQRGLSSLANLRSLGLLLHGCVGAPAIGEVGRALASKAALEELVLVLAGCTQVTTTADVGSQLPSLRSLRTLSLNFSTCERLSSLDELGAGLAGLRGAPLEHLSLGLSHCTGVRSLAAVARGIREAGGSLRGLSLWVKGCTRASDGAAELARALAALPALEDLELCLGDCRALPAAEVRELVRTLARLRPPSRFKADLSGCAVPDKRLGRCFSTHAEFCAEAAAVVPEAAA